MFVDRHVMVEAISEPVQTLPDRCVNFKLEGERFGVDVLKVREVLTSPEMTSVPGASSACIGVINLRGRILTVVDLRQLLGLPACSEAQSEHLLVVEQGDRMLGLLVDSVGEVMNIDPDAETTTNTSGPNQTDATLIVHTPQGFVALLDLDQILGASL